VLGLVLRFREYLSNPSIWNDEAELGINIIGRSYAGLTHPLASNQGAPLGFLFLEKTGVEIFGPNGPALRLFPFLASLVLLLVFRSLAMRTLGGWAGCVAIAVVAVSPSLVYYSTDAKQYSGDAMAVVLLAWVTVWVIERGQSTRSLLIWGLTCAVAVWFSFPAVLAAGASGVVLLVAARRSTADIVKTAGAGTIWVASFVLEYFVSLRSLHGNDTLETYWSYALAPQHGSKISWIYDVAVGTIHDPLGLIVVPLAAVLLAAGAVALLKERFTIGLFCVVLCGLTLLGGLVRQYPVADRLVLFLVPFASLMLGGTLLLFERFTLVLIAGIALVGATTVSSAAIALDRPYVMTSGRDALAYAETHAGKSDVVLIEGTVTNLYDFYHQTAGVTVSGNVQLLTSISGSDNCSPTAETAFLRHYQHVWLVYAPPVGIEPPSALAQYRNALAAAGPSNVVARFRGDTAVIEVDTHGRGDGATSLPPPSWEQGAHGCLSVYPFSGTGLYKVAVAYNADH
jgi:uncharacterized membrane protein